MPSRAPILAALLALGPFIALPADPTATHADAFTKDGLIKANVADLKDTQLVAHPDAPIAPNQNVIWCGTLQLAWNEAINLVGEKLQFVNQPPVVDLLNQQDFTSADLDPASYVAIADFERNHVEAEIRAALEKTFHGAASPELIPPVPPHPHPDDFVAYAYLFKNLAFPMPFREDTDNGTCFYVNNHDVSDPLKGFTFPKRSDENWSKVVQQVAIFDYKSESDFIIRIKTKLPDDQLILAEVSPDATLQDTIQSVLKRMATTKSVNPGNEDSLWVPQINLDLRGDFNNLEGLVLKPGPDARVKDLVTQEVKQLVRFQLNKEGALLKSEAVITMNGSAMQAPIDQHRMIFNKPFLILMKRTDAPQPYFAMWVGNASLLIPAK